MEAVKKFQSKWGNWNSKAINFYNSQERINTEDFFIWDNGYTYQDIMAIRSLEVGQEFSCEYGNHTVKRLV